MLKFPKNFTWGSATSAYQIEGGSQKDGKGPSIWDAFSTIPGKTLQGQTGNDACNHYELFKDDIALMKKMGIDAYRFSISWPRILPLGTGAVNEKGILFYNNLIDALLENNITPWITLYHWDLPLSLQMENDGWLNPEIADSFAAYAQVCFSRFGDRVKHWITLNEAWVISILGYGQGVFAPGRTSTHEPYIVGHHLLRAHAKAIDLYRSKYQSIQKGIIGISNNCDWREPKTDSIKDVQSAQRALEFFLAWFADPVYKGDYPDAMKERLGKRLPQFTVDESQLLKGSSDFFGLNHYTTMLAADGLSNESSVYGNGGISEDQDVDLSIDVDWQQTDMGWSIVPWGCFKLLQWIDQRYDRPDIYITENGCAFPDKQIKGEVNDQNRIDFLNGYLSQCHRAIDSGIKLKGYFVWSLLDNFEWALGYSKRFGLHYVDFDTQERIPKASAKWYAQVISNNGVFE